MRNGKTETTDITLLENLLYGVQQWERLLEVAEADVKRAEESRGRAKERLERYHALYKIENERLGKPLDGSPYEGLSLRDAVLKILERKSPRSVTFSTLISELKPWGFFAGTSHPSRSLHGALMRCTEAERIGQGEYRWFNGKANDGITQPEML